MAWPLGPASVAERFLALDPVFYYYSLWPKDIEILTRLHSTESNKGHMHTRLSKY